MSDDEINAIIIMCFGNGVSVHDSPQTLVTGVYDQFCR